MARLDIEEIDLAQLVATIRSRFETELEGSLVGRTRMRDAVADAVGCSLLEAEQLVDTLISQGYARLERDPEGQEYWHLSDPA